MTNKNEIIAAPIIGGLVGALSIAVLDSVITTTPFFGTVGMNALFGIIIGGGVMGALLADAIKNK